MERQNDFFSSVHLDRDVVSEAAIQLFLFQNRLSVLFFPRPEYNHDHDILEKKIVFSQCL